MGKSPKRSMNSHMDNSIQNVFEHIVHRHSSFTALKYPVQLLSNQALKNMFVSFLAEDQQPVKRSVAGEIYIDRKVQDPFTFGGLQKQVYTFFPSSYYRTFDAKANGMTFIVLKKLEKAIEEGDNIHSAIKGTTISNDKNQKSGFTALCVKGLSPTIIQAYQTKVY